MNRPAPVLAVAAGFAVGATSHAVDFARYGAWPYAFGGPILDLFWNALLPLDLTVMLLVLRRSPQVGLWAAVGVMILDVSANTYAWRRLEIDGFAFAVPVQGVFCLFVLWVAFRCRSRTRLATG